jgi:hypothetical protein
VLLSSRYVASSGARPLVQTPQVDGQQKWVTAQNEGSRRRNVIVTRTDVQKRKEVAQSGSISELVLFYWLDLVSSGQMGAFPFHHGQLPITAMILKPSLFFLFQTQRFRSRISDFNALPRMSGTSPIGSYIRSSAAVHALPFPPPQAYWRLVGAQCYRFVL